VRALLPRESSRKSAREHRITLAAAGMGLANHSIEERDVEKVSPVNLRSICALGSLAALAAACGSSAAVMPAVEATTSIRAAEAAGAQNEPKAALHLKRAKDQSARAEELLAKGDDEGARLLLDQAAVDAELALVLTHEVTAQADTEQVLQKVHELEQNNE
jgi:hypothetical protein